MAAAELLELLTPTLELLFPVPPPAELDELGVPELLEPPQPLSAIVTTTAKPHHRVRVAPVGRRPRGRLRRVMRHLHWFCLMWFLNTGGTLHPVCL